MASRTFILALGPGPYTAALDDGLALGFAIRPNFGPIPFTFVSILRNDIQKTEAICDTAQPLGLAPLVTVPFLAGASSGRNPYRYLRNPVEICKSLCTFVLIQFSLRTPDDLRNAANGYSVAFADLAQFCASRSHSHDLPIALSAPPVTHASTSGAAAHWVIHAGSGMGCQCVGGIGAMGGIGSFMRDQVWAWGLAPGPCTWLPSVPSRGPMLRPILPVQSRFRPAYLSAYPRPFFLPMGCRCNFAAVRFAIAVGIGGIGAIGSVPR